MASLERASRVIADAYLCTNSVGSFASTALLTVLAGCVVGIDAMTSAG